MEKRRAAVVLDSILLTAGIWLASYLWTSYYVMNLLVALIAATGISLCLLMLISIRRNKKRLSRKKQKLINDIMNQFLYGGKDFSLDFLHKALQKKFVGKGVVERHGDCIFVNKTAVFASFFVAPLSTDELLRYYVTATSLSAKQIIILTLSGCDKQARLSLASLPKIKATVFDKHRSYDFLGWLESFPSVELLPQSPKNSFSSLARSAFSPNRSRHYLSISLVLLVSSYFAFYSLYYIIAASTLLLLALLCKARLVRL